MLELLEVGKLVTDAQAWEIYADNFRPLSIPTPSSFPVIAYPIRTSGNSCPSSFLIITPGQIETLLKPPPEINHVNDFKDGEIEGVVVLESEAAAHVDDRGWLSELARSDEDGEVPMVYVSLTRPRVVRGPHEHRLQTDRFLFLGQATVWLWDNREGSATDKVRQRISVNGVAKVLIPPGVVHAYRSDHREFNLTVVNAPDQLYKGQGRQGPVDEVRHEDDSYSKFKLW